MAYTWSVPLIAQPTPDLCWKAGVAMMYEWRHRSQKKRARDRDFKQKGGFLATLRRGLSDVELNILARRLGMHTSQGMSADALQKHLGRGPVLTVLSAGSYQGRPNRHAVVVVSPRPSGLQGMDYEVADPCAASAGAACVAGTRLVAGGQVESTVANGFSWFWS